MPIENRNLPAGTILQATYRKAAYTCDVVETGDGLRFRYAGKDYASPSAAGSAVMGGVACNGWRFWSVAGDIPAVPADAPMTATSRQKGKTKAMSSVVRQVRRVPNQKGVPDGQAKWFCSCCMASFLVDGDIVPDACPRSHPREAVDDLAPASGTTDNGVAS